MRRLAWASAGFSAAVFLSFYLLPPRLLPWAALASALAALGLGLARRNGLRRLVIFSAAFAVGCLYFCGAYLLKSVPAQRMDGESAELEGTVLTYPVDCGGYFRYELRAALPTGGVTRIVVYDRSGAVPEDMAPGWRIRISASCRRADMRYGEDFEYYNANGVFVIAGVKAPPVLLSCSRSAFLSFGQNISRAVCRRAEELFPADTVPFMQSLLIGSRSGLYADAGTYTALNRAGMSHIVAISGMHVAFMIAVVQLLFGLSRAGALGCIAAVWVFVTASGGSPSAARAGVMQTLLLIAPAFSRECDAATSLSSALAVLLIENPFAAGSASLQLSFGAVAGLLLAAGPLSDTLYSLLPRRLRWDIRRGISNIIAAPIAVLVFTVPLTALHFGYAAVLSPLANLLCLWAVSLCFCGGYLACLIGAIAAPLGAAAAWLISWLARYIVFIAKLVSAAPFAAIYMNDAFNIAWLCLSCGFFALSAYAALPPAARLALPTAASALTLAALLLANSLGSRLGAGTVTVLDVGQGQCISIFSGESTVLIDCGGLYSLDNAGDTAASYLLTHGRRRVDALLLTHLHADHANGVTQLLQLTEVGELILPDGVEDGDGLLPGILAAAEARGTAIHLVTRDETLTAGDISLTLYAPAESGDVNERCMLIRASIGNYDMLVTGDAPEAVETAFAASHGLGGTELLIVGHHGSRLSCGQALLDALGAETAVISVGCNYYGHPAEETLERLARSGYNVYRTDLNGNVKIRIPAG